MKFQSIRDDVAKNVDFMTKGIAYSAENTSSRRAGGVSEKDAAEHFAGILSASGAKTSTEEFKVAPYAAYGWLNVTVVCMALAFVAYFFVSMMSVAFILVGLIAFITQGLLLSRTFDGAYVSGTSRNVTAVIPCSDEVRKRVFFTAHLDSAPAFRYPLRGKALAAVIAVCILGALYLLAASVARWAYLGSIGTGLASDEWLAVGLVGIVFLPFWAACLFMFDFKSFVNGSADDLSGCYVATALAKAIAESGEKLRHTEVGVILTGSEECGLRGAKAWCDAHAEEYKNTETYFLTLDTLRDAEYLKVQDRDLNGLIGLDKGAVKLFAGAAEKEGVKCAAKGAAFGATDAAAFAAAGLKAASVTAMIPFADYYHTEKDSGDNVDPELLGKCFIAALRVVEDLEDAGSEK